MAQIWFIDCKHQQTVCPFLLSIPSQLAYIPTISHNLSKFFYSSLIDPSEEESKKPKLEENHQTTTHPDTHPDPQLPSDEDMEDILEHIDEDVEIPDDTSDTDLEDTDMITDTIPLLKGNFVILAKKYPI